MSQRPILKLKLGKSAAAAASPPEPPPQNKNRPKLKLKFGGQRTPGPSTPTANGPAKPTAADAKSEKPKAPRIKFKTPKKRAHEDGSSGSAAPRPQIKRIKLNTKPKPPPAIIFKAKGQPRPRPNGVGYDSEASDTEIDPALEEQFILRMLPGEDCEYIRTAIEEKRWGPRAQGGADISFKALTRDGRRATVTVRGNMYAASLVDLPCIVEGMKSWDRRGWFKSADICQMLLVLGRVENDAQALEYPLPKDVDASTWQYAHGLTPPLRWVRKRRFRKRISNRTIQAVEMEVARLLKADQEAIHPPTFEVMDYATYMREQQMEEEGEEEEYEYYDEEQDAEGEEYYDEAGQDMDDALAAEMEAALAAHVDESAAAGADTQPTQEPAPAEGVPAAEGAEAAVDALFEAGSPQTKATPGETSGDEEESDESSPEDDDQDEADADLDEDALEEQRQKQQLREEAAELETLVAAETKRWEAMGNPILKRKLGDRVRELKQALNLKKVALGEEVE